MPGAPVRGPTPVTEKAGSQRRHAWLNGDCGAATLASDTTGSEGRKVSEIWRQCKGERHIRPLQGRLVRLVESQEQVATLQLVDTLEEQALLEELLESSKPPVPADAEPLHYLLKTPFRYPPLRWGRGLAVATSQACSTPR